MCNESTALALAWIGIACSTLAFTVARVRAREGNKAPAFWGAVSGAVPWLLVFTLLHSGTQYIGPRPGWMDIFFAILFLTLLFLPLSLWGRSLGVRQRTNPDAGFSTTAKVIGGLLAVLVAANWAYSAWIAYMPFAQVGLKRAEIEREAERDRLYLADLCQRNPKHSACPKVSFDDLIAAKSPASPVQALDAGPPIQAPSQPEESYTLRTRDFGFRFLYPSNWRRIAASGNVQGAVTSDDGVTCLVVLLKEDFKSFSRRDVAEAFLTTWTENDWRAFLGPRTTQLAFYQRDMKRIGDRMSQFAIYGRVYEAEGKVIYAKAASLVTIYRGKTWHFNCAAGSENEKRAGERFASNQSLVLRAINSFRLE